MKKWFTVAAAVVLSLSLVIGIACGGGGEDEEGVTTLKYGCGAPLSGAYGFVGFAVRFCMELAAEDIGVFEVGGELYRWKCVYEDNKNRKPSHASILRLWLISKKIDFFDLPKLPVFFPQGLIQQAHV